MKKKTTQSIIMYGFDKIGFKLPENNLINSSGLIIEFIPFGENIETKKIDGIIIPQGIFEKFVEYDNIIDSGTKVTFYENLLLGIERKVISHLRDGKWICFLVKEIVDLVKVGYDTNSVENTDLCKRILNLFDIKRIPISGKTTVKSKSNEFDNYIENYGVAKTKFIFSKNEKQNCKVIATNGNSIVGFDRLANIFFLPFHTIKSSNNESEKFSKDLCTSILSYRQKRIIETPEWLNDFEFKPETKVKKETELLLAKIEKNYSKLTQFGKYKAILTTSGENLRNIILDIFENIFELKINPIDEFIEDFKIIDSDDNILTIVEVKGTKKGIKREFINQVDSHRERNKLSADTLGILIINNEMGIENIQLRQETVVPNPQIIHAKNMNVLILRTIDLLYLTNQFLDATDKGKIIRLLLDSKGGWLKVNKNNYELITEPVSSDS